MKIKNLSVTLAILFASIIHSFCLAQEKAIHIGSSHQLFLDDFIIQKKENIQRKVQAAKKHNQNPLIVRAHQWEPVGYVMPSVLYDEEEKIFKAWLDGYGVGVFYFTSKDGIQWERPKLHLFPEFDNQPTNRVILSGYEFDTKEAPREKLAYLRSREDGWKYFCYQSGVIKDKEDPDPNRRYKMAFLWIDREFRSPGAAKAGKLTAMGVAFSPDGIHWKPVNKPVSYATLDAPFHITRDQSKKCWVMHGRAFGVISPGKKLAQASDPNFQYNMGRSVIRCESTDFLNWTPEKGEVVLSSDESDSVMTEIYDMRPLNIHGMNLGLIHVFLNNPDNVTLPIQLGVSRDGKKWNRLEDRSSFLSPGELGDWDRGVFSPPVSDPVQVGDEIRFYYTGRNLLHSTRWKFDDDPKLLPAMAPYRGALGFASIRRDRFVAMEASYKPGIIQTKPFIHNGGTLHVNGAFKFGALQVSVLDENNKSIQKTTILEKDDTKIPLPALTKASSSKGSPIRLEFSIQNGRLFSFWFE